MCCRDQEERDRCESEHVDRSESGHDDVGFLAEGDNCGISKASGGNMYAWPWYSWGDSHVDIMWARIQY